MLPKSPFRLALLTALLPLAACSQTSIQIETPLPTPIVVLSTATPPAAPTQPPTDSPTSNPATPTTVPATPTTVPPTPAGLLPAPLYFIATDNQLWRIERDGQTLTQITHEDAAITSFDTSPADGTLAYVVNNTLVRADANGGNRLVLVTGPALQGTDDDFIVRTLMAPRWSPDGQTLVYGLNGVNRIAATGGSPEILLPSDAIPQTRARARFYRPHAWSPDGSRLLIQYGLWMEGGGYLVRNMTDGTLVEPSQEVCCEPVWNADGQAVYFWGASVEGYNDPGLWQLDPISGAVQALIAPNGNRFSASELTLVRAPYAQADGQLLLWLRQTRNENGTWPDHPFQLFRANPADIGHPTLLRPDTHHFYFSAWAPNGAGVVLLELTEPVPHQQEQHLLWVPANDGPAVTLPGEITTSNSQPAIFFMWGK